MRVHTSGSSCSGLAKRYDQYIESDQCSLHLARALQPSDPRGSRCSRPAFCRKGETPIRLVLSKLWPVGVPRSGSGSRWLEAANTALNQTPSASCLMLRAAPSRECVCRLIVADNISTTLPATLLLFFHGRGCGRILKCSENHSASSVHVLMLGVSLSLPLQSRFLEERAPQPSYPAITRAVSWLHAVRSLQVSMPRSKPPALL